MKYSKTTAQKLAAQIRQWFGLKIARAVADTPVPQKFVALHNMCPDPPNANVSYMAPTDTEFPAELSMGHSGGVKAADLPHDLIGKHSVPVTFSAKRVLVHMVPLAAHACSSQVFYRMTNILKSRYIFEIRQAVVSFNSVDVVYLKPFRSRPQECLSYNGMNLYNSRSIVVAQPDLRIAAPVRLWSKYISGSYTAPVDVSPDAAKVGNAIDVFVADYWFPFFSGKLIVSQGVNLLRQGLALVRPVRLYPQSFGPFCILAQ